jgi:tRNA1Val (adenine37-N6)-methyltransferase
MANSWFSFKQFTIHQDRCAMKVTTDACLFGAWIASYVETNTKQAGSLLDIGAGSGLLSLMLAQKVPYRIDSVEIDPEACRQAGENAEASPWPGKIKVHHADIKSFTPGLQYDLIVSNPPFYENELKSGNSKKNIAHHSEVLPLEDLLSVISKLLLPGGRFFLLLPYKRNNEINEVFKKYALHVTDKIMVRQSIAHDYFRIMIAGTSGKEQSTLKTGELAVTGEGGNYTPEFIALLKEYYLYL